MLFLLNGLIIYTKIILSYVSYHRFIKINLQIGCKKATLTRVRLSFINIYEIGLRGLSNTRKDLLGCSRPIEWFKKNADEQYRISNNNVVQFLFARWCYILVIILFGRFDFNNFIKFEIFIHRTDFDWYQQHKFNLNVDTRAWQLLCT